MNIRERFITYANAFYEKSGLSSKNTLYENVLDAVDNLLSDKPNLYEVDLSNLDPYPFIFDTDTYPVNDVNVEAQEAQLQALMDEQIPYLDNFFVHFPTQHVFIKVSDDKMVKFEFDSGEVVVTITDI